MIEDTPPMSLGLARAGIFLCVCLMVPLLLAGNAARALEVSLEVAGDDAALTDRLRDSSALIAASAEGEGAPEALFAAARSDYRRLTEALFAAGRYGGAVSIRLDGREAGEIGLLDVPGRVDRADISVAPGPVYRLGRVEIDPLPPDATLPEGATPGAPARAEVIRDAARGAVGAWREAGHAEARVADQRVIADHPSRTLDVTVRIEPGARLAFGELIVGDSAVRAGRVREIAGLPTGRQFSPDALERSVERLRETGAFASVTAREQPAAGGRVPIELSLVDGEPRRVGGGAELTTSEGLSLSGFWLHRNLFGGAERLRFDAEVTNLATDESGTDGRVAARIERPASFGPETSVFIASELTFSDEDAYIARTARLGTGFKRRVNETLEIEYGIALSQTFASQEFGASNFTLLSFPAAATRDRRDDPLDATRGAFLDLEAEPFLGAGDAGSGVRLELDMRGYRALGEDLVLAGRARAGSVIGPSLASAQPEMLFTSGGGGSVRGQPFDSLTVMLPGGDETGGRSMVGVSGELRAGLRGNFGLAAFLDAGYVGPEALYDGSGAWHSGGGVGLRYDTGLGPIRFDVAGPVSGGTGDGVQFYLGIGQAF